MSAQKIGYEKVLVDMESPGTLQVYTILAFPEQTFYNNFYYRVINWNIEVGPFDTVLEAMNSFMRQSAMRKESAEKKNNVTFVDFVSKKVLK